MKKILFWLSVLMISTSLLMNCGKNDAQTKSEPKTQTAKIVQNDSTKTKTPKVTFVELGSVSCIPCKMMQPIMKAVEEDYGDQIKVVFYDVRQDRAQAEKYQIRLIPTQVFLDEKREEFFRHEGFYSKDEIEKLLLDKGLIKLESKMEPKLESTSKVDSNLSMKKN